MLSILQQLSGINVIIFFSNTVAIIPRDSTHAFTFVIGTVNWLSTLFAMVLMRYYGRKTLLLWGQLAMCAWNSLLFLIYKDSLDQNASRSLQYGVMALVVLFVISFATTIGPICWIHLAEIMTEKGMSIAVWINWWAVIFISYLPTIKSPEKSGNDGNNQRDLSIFFFFFSGVSISGFFLINLFIKETKGLNPKKIMTLYKHEDYNPLTHE